MEDVQLPTMIFKTDYHECVEGNTQERLLGVVFVQNLKMGAICAMGDIYILQKYIKSKISSVKVITGYK